jgi:hypothetical protein
MALIRYCEELKGDIPELSKKAIYEKASNIFNVQLISKLSSTYTSKIKKSI